MWNIITGIVIWSNEHTNFRIVEIPVPLDTAIQKAYKEKEGKFIKSKYFTPQYTLYKFTIVVVTVGGLGVKFSVALYTACINCDTSVIEHTYHIHKGIRTKIHE